MFDFYFLYQPATALKHFCAQARFVLFGLRPLAALHLRRSPLNHGHGQASSGDHPNCLAADALIPESLVNYSG
jgi:hypothetical protein